MVGGSIDLFFKVVWAHSPASYSDVNLEGDYCLFEVWIFLLFFCLIVDLFSLALSLPSRESQALKNGLSPGEF